MKGLAALVATLAALPAEAACRQALALALDVSGSVDRGEYRLQLDGLAGALIAPEVRAAILSTPERPVHLVVFEWSGPDDQRILVPWTVIDTAAALDGVVAQLTGTSRRRAQPTTALGEAILLGGQLLAQRPDCWSHTLDISGDGKSNTGMRPQDVILPDIAGPVIINALVIGTSGGLPDIPGPGDLDELVAYFERTVIRGPGAFVETANGFADYEEAMRRKLLRELQSFAIGTAESRARPLP